MGDPAELVYLEDIPGATGFPYKVMPTSWFQIDWSDTLKVGDVRPLKYFDQHLVLFRTEDGQANLTSAFCPHMGAHLGHGGRVDENRIVCPYHGWEWNKDGSCALVPSEGKPSTARRGLKTWDVVESNGIIWTWHDALGRPPMWSAPEERRHEDKFLPVFPHCTYKWEHIRARPQFIAENTVDLDHLIFVHKNGLLPVVRHEDQIPVYVEEGHVWANRRPFPLQSSTCEGIGIVVVDFPFDAQRPHRMPGILYHSTTPIDSEHSDMFGTMLVRQDTTADGCEGDKPVGNALKRVEEQIKQAGRDVPIWHHMVYMDRPAYARLEGPQFMRLRRWAEQFYPQGDKAEAAASATRTARPAA